MGSIFTNQFVLEPTPTKMIPRSSLKTGDFASLMNMVNTDGILERNSLKRKEFGLSENFTASSKPSVIMASEAEMKVGEYMAEEELKMVEEEVVESEELVVVRECMVMERSFIEKTLEEHIENHEIDEIIDGAIEKIDEVVAEVTQKNKEVDNDTFMERVDKFIESTANIDVVSEEPINFSNKPLETQNIETKGIQIEKPKPKTSETSDDYEIEQLESRRDSMFVHTDNSHINDFEIVSSTRLKTFEEIEISSTKSLQSESTDSQETNTREIKAHDDFEDSELTSVRTYENNTIEQIVNSEVDRFIEQYRVVFLKVI